MAQSYRPEICLSLSPTPRTFLFFLVLYPYTTLLLNKNSKRSEGDDSKEEEEEEKKSLQTEWHYITGLLFTREAPFTQRSTLQKKKSAKGIKHTALINLH